MCFRGSVRTDPIKKPLIGSVVFSNVMLSTAAAMASINDLGKE